VSVWTWLLLIVVLVPVLALSIYALLDFVRRADISGLRKAWWIAAIALLPLVGAVLYLIFRPSRPGDIRGFGHRRATNGRMRLLLPGNTDDDSTQ
jgi:hypothetical protein